MLRGRTAQDLLSSLMSLFSTPGCQLLLASEATSLLPKQPHTVYYFMHGLITTCAVKSAHAWSAIDYGGREIHTHMKIMI